MKFIMVHTANGWYAPGHSGISTAKILKYECFHTIRKLYFFQLRHLKKISWKYSALGRQRIVILITISHNLSNLTFSVGGSLPVHRVKKNSTAIGKQIHSFFRVSGSILAKLFLVLQGFMHGRMLPPN